MGALRYGIGFLGDCAHIIAVLGLGLLFLAAVVL